MKLIYVLGMPYSGTTLFGLMLDQHPAVLNLGEVVNLEHDYTSDTNCTCGRTLSSCPFWAPLYASLTNLQGALPDHERWMAQKRSRRDDLDRKGGWFKVMIMLGFPLKWIMGRRRLSGYVAKHEAFFRGVGRLNPGARYLVDVSKAPERIDALKSSAGLEIYVIFLKRSAWSVYASAMRRRGRRWLGLYAIRESVWQLLRWRHCQRLYKTLPEGRKIEVSYAEWIAKPVQTRAFVLGWLGLTPGQASGGGSGEIRPAEHHIYVGNRWLFRDPPAQVELSVRRGEECLTRFQRAVFHVAGLFLGIPKG